MDRELQNNKRLREMFRLFQRAKKHLKKMKEQEEDEDLPLPTIQPGRRSAERRSSRKSTANRRKRSYSRKKLVTSEEIPEEEEEAQPSPEPSESEKRRQRLRKKYGIRSKDEQFFQRASKEDVEEFENVNAAFRPAATKMRKAKLRWKTVEDKQESAGPQPNNAEKDLVILDGTCKFDSDSSSNTLVKWDEPRVVDHSDYIDYTQFSDEEKSPSQDDGGKATKMQEKSEGKISRLLKEVTKLLVRIADLEKTQQKALITIKNQRIDLADKEKEIKDLKKRIAYFERKEMEMHAMEKVAEKPLEEDDKLTPQQEAVALRGLSIMKRNQILEQVLKPAEANILAEFFHADMAKPNKTIVQLIDKAFAYGIDVLLMRPELFEDVVDNELRLLMLDSAKAKRILLDCMLLHPEYVPISWGGDVLAKRQQQQQQTGVEKPSIKPTDTAAEKSPGNTIFQNPKALSDMFDTKSSLPEGFLKAGNDNVNRSIFAGEKIEKKLGEEPVKTDVSSPNERNILQSEVIQEKSAYRMAEQVRDDVEDRNRTAYSAVNLFPNPNVLTQSNVWDNDRGKRELRRRKTKSRQTPKRKGRRRRE